MQKTLLSMFMAMASPYGAIQKGVPSLGHFAGICQKTVIINLQTNNVINGKGAVMCNAVMLALSSKLQKWLSLSLFVNSPLPLAP